MPIQLILFAKSRCMNGRRRSLSKIIKLEGTEVYIGMDDQKIVKAPISAVNYPNPQVGDEIRIF